TATVRLVGWFNLNRLGITTCDGFDAVLISSLITGKGLSVSTPIKAGSNRLEFEEVEIKGPDIFSRYSYKGLEGLLMYPYDYFAIRYRLSWLFDENCLPDIDFEPVECIEV